MEELEGRMSAAAHRAMVQSAADARFNTLRVWGGGMVLPEAWYDACDELGIMVFHDMQYAGLGHGAANTTTQESELRHSVRRLSHHPAIVMWDGCNECSVQMGSDTAVYATFVMTVVPCYRMGNGSAHTDGPSQRESPHHATQTAHHRRRESACMAGEHVSAAAWSGPLRHRDARAVHAWKRLHRRKWRGLSATLPGQSPRRPHRPCASRAGSAQHVCFRVRLLRVLELRVHEPDSGSGALGHPCRHEGRPRHKPNV